MEGSSSAWRLATCGARSWELLLLLELVDLGYADLDGSEFLCEDLDEAEVVVAGGGAAGVGGGGGGGGRRGGADCVEGGGGGAGVLL